KMGIPGEDAQGIMEALDFLYQVNSGKTPAIGPHVVVIGGGDVAMDAARCALRQPGVKSVQVAYRRSRAEMPAHRWEAAEALEEGVIFQTDLGPARIETAGGKVSAIAFHPRVAGSGLTRQIEPRFDELKTIVLSANTVIVAIGQAIDSADLGVVTGSSGRISADKGTLATSVAGIFAGGDAVLGPASIADAMGQGHVAADAIDAYLRGGKLATAPPATAQAQPARNPKPGAPREDRVPMAQTDLATRRRAFTEINRGYTAEQAIAEAKRCLACGLCSECMECVKACSPGAICHDQQAQARQLEVGSVILTPGFEEFQASLRGEFGHGRYSNVLSSVQFERMLSAAGPTGGVLQRPSD